MVKTITKEEVNKLPIKAWDGETEVIDKIDRLYEVIDELKDEDILGFDTETRPSFKKGQKNKVALLQLAGKNKVWLFRLNKIGFHPQLVQLMEDSTIIKVGVGILDDLRGMNALSAFTPENFTDLNKVAEETGFDVLGVRKLTALILGFRVSKKQQTSDWEAEPLNEKQIAYAATDAWVCRGMFLKMSEIGVL